MISQICFHEPLDAILKSGFFGAVSTTVLLTIIHYFNEIKNLGYLQSLYLPGLIVTIDFIKCSYINGIPSFTKHFKWMAFKSIILIIISICSFFILAILYGVPAFTEHEQTLMFAIFLTTCSTVHCLMNMGFKEFNIMLTKQSNYNVIQLNSSQVVAVSSIFGCWSASIVIPLDWDRWWQKWPIPSIIGTLLGYSIGHLLIIVLALYYQKQKKKTHV